MFLVSIHWMPFTAAPPAPLSSKHQEWLQTCSLGYNPPPVENYWSRTRFFGLCKLHFFMEIQFCEQDSTPQPSERVATLHFTEEKG